MIGLMIAVLLGAGAPPVPGTSSPETVCGSNLHCQWRAELFASEALFEIIDDNDADAALNAAEAHMFRAMDLCIAARECTQAEADAWHACMKTGRCE